MKYFFIFLMMGVMGASLLLTPFVASAQNPGQKGYFILNFECSGEPIPGAKDSDGKPENECNFSDLMTLIDRIITLLLYVAFVLATISFVYAGFLMIFSGGNEDAVKSAKHIFKNVVIGLILAYIAWTLVHFVLTTFGVSDDYTLLEKK